MAFDARGDVYYADSGANVVREITVTATEPSAPLNLKATASAGKVALGWSPPGGSGGPPVLGYSAYKATRSGGENYAGAAACTSKGAATTHCTVTGLTNGKTYWFTVTARNVVAMGPASNQVSAKP